MSNISKTKKIMKIFALLSVILILLSIVSFILTNRNSAMGEETVTSDGTLSSYELRSNKYYGLYKFQYNGKEWNYLSAKGYKDSEKIPNTLSITHNRFTSLEDMKTYSDSNVFFYAPFIYILALITCGSLFLTYRSRYKDLLLLEQTKVTVIDPEEI